MAAMYENVKFTMKIEERGRGTKKKTKKNEYLAEGEKIEEV